MVASMTEQNAEDGLAELEALPGGARAALEAVLMVIDEPATSEELAAGLNVTVAVVEDLLQDLQREYSGYTVKAPDVDVDGFAAASTAPRGFELRNVAGGWR